MLLASGAVSGGWWFLDILPGGVRVDGSCSTLCLQWRVYSFTICGSIRAQLTFLMSRSKNYFKVHMLEMFLTFTLNLLFSQKKKVFFLSPFCFWLCHNRIDVVVLQKVETRYSSHMSNSWTNKHPNSLKIKAYSLLQACWTIQLLVF